MDIKRWYNCLQAVFNLEENLKIVSYQLDHLLAYFHVKGK